MNLTFPSVPGRFDGALNGDPGQIRTGGPLLRGQLLYPTELQSHITKSAYKNISKKKVVCYNFFDIFIKEVFMALDFKKIRDEFKFLFKKIKEYDTIVLYRHLIPDYDAFGSQMGLANWIKENFPNKEVHFVGESNPKWVPSIYPQPEVLDEVWFAKHRFLAIVTDTATKARISCNSIEKADFVLKIDHHPAVENFGNYNIVYPDMVAASELVALFVLSRPRRYKVSPLTAKYLYSGIVGDSGRFLYPPVDGATLSISSDLLKTGFDVQALYDTMYAKTMNDMNNLKLVLNNTKFTKGGTAYYVLTDADLKKMNITMGEGKVFVNQFRDVKGIYVTVSVTEDSPNHNYRVSIRSNHKRIDEIATKYRGGGHEAASGATLESLDELPSLLKDLDDAKVLR